jgi:branched-chain amino acid transport system permease protein
MMSFGTMFTIFFTWLFQSWGISIKPLPTALLALPFGIIATMLLALVMDKTVYRYHRENKSSNVIFLIVSIGTMFVIGGIVRFAIGPADQIFFDGTRFLMKAREFKEMTGLREGMAIKMTQAITIVTAVIVVAFIWWFLNKTRTGKSMRAYSDNENLALLSGIDPARVVMVAWLLVAALAAIAGTLYGLDKSFKPFTYMQLLLPIFAAAIVGGVGNPLGAIAGGYVIALSEIAVTFAYKRVLGYLAPEGLEPSGLVQLLSTDYKIAVSFVILVIVLVIKPTGLFSGKTL